MSKGGEAITPDFVVQQLCEKTESGEIEWRYNYNADRLTATTNGISLLLHPVPMGRESSRLRLEILSGVEETHIDEPQIHISAAPSGRLLRFVGASAGNPPEVGEAAEKEKLRINLENLHSLAMKQYSLREEPSNKKVIKQKLFRKVTGMK